MAGKKSLPDVSQKVIANAEQYINEFKRAERAQRSSTVAMDKELDRLQKSVGRKFSVADFGKDILKGLGIGSGFNVAMLAVDQFVNLWREADEKAKEAQVTIDKLNTSFRELNRLTHESALNRMLPADELAARRADLAKIIEQQDESSRKQAELSSDLAKAKDQTAWSGSAFDPLQGKYGDFHTGATISDIITEKMDAENQRFSDLGKERRKLADQIEADTKKLVDVELKDWFGSIDSLQKELDKAALERSKQSDFSGGGSMGLISISTEIEAAKVNAQLQAMLDNGKSLVDMAHDIQAARPFLFDPKEIDKSITGFRMMEVEAKKMKEVNDALTLFFEPIDKQQEELDRLAELDKKANEVSRTIERSINRAADAITDTWVDALNGVEGAWGDLGQVVVREIEAMIVKLLLVTPLMHALGGIFGGLGWSTLAEGFSGYGGARAAGGDVEAGKTYLVGENGPELKTFRSGGTIIPNKMLGGGGGNKTFYIDARGADRTGLAQLFSYIRQVDGSIEERSVAANLDAGRRTLARG